MSNENPAVESLRQEQDIRREEKRGKISDQKLTEALKDTFPASDPVAQQIPVKPGAGEDRS